MTIETALGYSAIVIILAFVLLMILYKRQEVKAWLLVAVENAEKALGAKRGQEKLQLVHTLLIKQFPIIGRLLPFALFSHMVDVALDIMEQHLEDEKEE